jgi:pimeloyl-ACP methyl ester carboxylesterase
MKTGQIFLEVNRLRFPAYAVGPETGELVLFLHGFPEFADMWLPVMSAIAAADFRAVAVTQRGYSPEARPLQVEEYTVNHLLADILGLADRWGAQSFHLVAHDWGGLLAWHIAAAHPDRLHSLTVLSTPHPDAFFEAIQTDEDQKQRSRYMEFFRMPGGVAESYFQADGFQRLRNVYQGRVSEKRIEANMRRLAEPGALTAALNWYRALDFTARIGSVSVPTLFVWGSADMAVGETTAIRTADHVTGPYRFERLEGMSHWLVDETPELITRLVLKQIQRDF